MAVAVITYDRAHYLSLVLPSILAQTVDGRPILECFDIYAFQDGFCHDDTRSSEDGHRRVGELLRGLPDYIQKFEQPKNLGVALHFDFIEKHLFRENKYDFVLFCEDDLVLSPQYVSVIKQMADRFQDDNRIGMLSAHPANPCKPQSEQLARLGDFAEMGHNWGFGLFRKFWESRQPLVDTYLNFIRDVPYRLRPEKKIFEWLNSVGFNPNASSQDYVKTCATIALGAAKISTFPNFGLPIGRNGLHSRPELFDRLGFAGTVVCDSQFDGPGELTDERIETILGAQRRICLKDPSTFPPPAKWRETVASGTLDPEKLLGGSAKSFVPAAAAPARFWSSSDIPRKPHMEPEGIALLTERLKRSGCFLEYGAGGSTVLAAEIGVGTIYSVESDRGFLNAVKDAVAETPGETQVVDHYVDIGPTADWGNPTDSSRAVSWPLYPSSIWNEILDGGMAQPDLVLIDGRFRVACFLATLTFSNPSTIILFDDYYDRPNYHVIEKYVTPVSRAGRMAEFRKSQNCPREAVLDLMAYSTQFG